MNNQLISELPGLVAYYPHTEGSGSTLNDYSGNGNNGTLVNTPIWNKTTKGNYSIKYDGSSEYTGRSGTFAASNIVGTIAYWFKVDSNPGGVIAMISFGDNSSTSPYIGFGMESNGYIRGDFNQPSASPGVARSLYQYETNKADALWHFVVLTQTGTGFKLYVDGVDVTSSTNWTSGASTNENWIGSQSGIDLFTIGALRRSTTSQYFNGTIGDVFYSNTSWSNELIQQVYKKTYRA